jgi:hypothetical protein
LFTVGFLPGDSIEDRLALLASPHRLRSLIVGIRARINQFLGKAVEVVRTRFGGKLSYASLPFEGVDWGPFDIISTDAGYRSAEIAARFRDDIRAFVAQGQGKRWRSLSSGAPPTAARPIWAAVEIQSSSGAMAPDWSGSRANTRVTKTSRPGRLANCWTSSRLRASTPCS